jgi:hypothetical protein
MPAHPLALLALPEEVERVLEDEFVGVARLWLDVDADHVEACGCVAGGGAALAAKKV